jgi:hypothetical protein
VFHQGVGGALILSGRMYRGSKSMAPEPGHLAVEYPRVPDGAEKRTHARDGGMRLAFGDECLCSSRDHKMYGHVDTLATPSRIEGQLSLLFNDTVSLAQAAAAPRAVPGGEKDHLVVSEEAKVMHRAGRALGRGLVHIINIVNPGQIVLLVPKPLAVPAPGSSGAEYLDAVENELDNAYSTGPADARDGIGHIRLPVQSYEDDDIASRGAIAAATTAFNAFIEHASGFDGCPSQPLSEKGDVPGQRGPSAAVGGHRMSLEQSGSPGENPAAARVRETCS